jgi:hypothetical protein
MEVKIKTILILMYPNGQAIRIQVQVTIASMTKPLIAFS